MHSSTMQEKFFILLILTLAATMTSSTSPFFPVCGPREPCPSGYICINNYCEFNNIRRPEFRIAPISLANTRATMAVSGRKKNSRNEKIKFQQQPNFNLV